VSPISCNNRPADEISVDAVQLQDGQPVGDLAGTRTRQAHCARSGRLGYRQQTGSKQQPGAGIGLDDIGRGATSVLKPRNALHRNERRHPELDTRPGRRCGQRACGEPDSRRKLVRSGRRQRVITQPAGHGEHRCPGLRGIDGTASGHCRAIVSRRPEAIETAHRSRQACRLKVRSVGSLNVTFCAQAPSDREVLAVPYSGLGRPDDAANPRAVGDGLQILQPGHPGEQ